MLKSNINFFRANLPKSLIAVKKSLRSHSSVSCKSLTPYTNTFWSTTSPRWAGSSPSSTLHPTRRGDEGFLQLLRETRWGQREVHSTLLKADIGRNLLTRGRHSRSSHQIHSKAICQWYTSLHWSSWLTRSSIPSRISHRLDVQDQSSIISFSLGQRNTTPIMNPKGTKPSTVGPYKSTWNCSFNRASSKKYVLTPEPASG